MKGHILSAVLGSIRVASRRGSIVVVSLSINSVINVVNSVINVVIAPVAVTRIRCLRWEVTTGFTSLL